MKKERSKILSVLGTRPETIKMAPVIKELSNHTDQFISRVCVTGQHREMLDQALKHAGGLDSENELGVGLEAEVDALELEEAGREQRRTDEEREAHGGHDRPPPVEREDPAEHHSGTEERQPGHEWMRPVQHSF